MSKNNVIAKLTLTAGLGLGLIGGNALIAGADTPALPPAQMDLDLGPGSQPEPPKFDLDLGGVDPVDPEPVPEADLDIATPQNLPEPHPAPKQGPDGFAIPTPQPDPTPGPGDITDVPDDDDPFDGPGDITDVPDDDGPFDGPDDFTDVPDDDGPFDGPDDFADAPDEPTDPADEPTDPAPETETETPEAEVPEADVEATGGDVDVESTNDGEALAFTGAGSYLLAAIGTALAGVGVAVTRMVRRKTN